MNDLTLPPTESPHLPQTQDNPGTLRLIAWMLNGLEIDVKRAKLASTGDGLVKDLFWVSDQHGAKLKNTEAVRERLEECLAGHSNVSPTGNIFSRSGVTVDNSAELPNTVVRLASQGGRTGSAILLEVASTLSGLGLNIQEARGGEGDGSWEFAVVNTNGKKLDNNEAASLLFAVLLISQSTITASSYYTHSPSASTVSCSASTRQKLRTLSGDAGNVAATAADRGS